MIEGDCHGRPKQEKKRMKIQKSLIHLIVEKDRW
jgi:hypothetical protein